MKSLGFEDAVVVLTTYLQKIREVSLETSSPRHCSTSVHKASDCSTFKPALMHQKKMTLLQAEGVEKQAKSANVADGRDSHTGAAASASATQVAPSMVRS
jgi:hypothetical protein